MTALGTPVVPEVKARYATLSGLSSTGARPRAPASDAGSSGPGVRARGSRQILRSPGSVAS